MELQGKRGEEARTHSRLLDIALLCILCIALNIIGSKLALLLNLPVYLDCAGTIFAGILGGYVPAIVVGYLTNLINGIFDGATMYYGITNVLIAIAAAFFAKRGWFKELPLILLTIPVFTILGGGVGSILTFFLYGVGFSDGVSAQFAHQLYDNGLTNVFAAQLCADLFIDFIDKSLTVLFVALLYHLIPEEYLERVDFTPWQQAPMTQNELNETMSAKPRVMSLQTKFVIVIGVLVILVAITTTAVSYILFHRSMIETESAQANSVANLLEQSIGPNRVDEYISMGKDAPGYRETEKRFEKIIESFPGVEYVCVYQIQDDGCHIVFYPDSDDGSGLEPGIVAPVNPAFKQYLPQLLAGEEIEPVITNDSNGRLLIAHRPLKNSEGITACYLAVGVSLEQLVSDESEFLTNVIALFAAFFVLVCAIFLWVARYGIILPVNSIARATSDFTLGDESVQSISAAQIDELDIKTGDEIENMYGAINQMSHEAVEYTADAQEKSELIENMQDNLIMVMADLVESRDQFTGDHVRNTAAYTRIVMNQMRREGIYPDMLTNEFISNVNKSAPLHDVGKIAVSDTILNKPGRFTNEEFEIMKNHTIAGKEILEKAKGAVSEPSYLDEAQRLAAYHHEKWNGTGYPYGLEGEDIPLSARIMAVADVFDALVSKRSYKRGFSVDKALSIIEDGIGTHFDPQVARAFLHAQDKARAVAKMSEKKKAERDQAAAEAQAQAEQAASEQDDSSKPEANEGATDKPDTPDNGTS